MKGTVRLIVTTVFLCVVFPYAVQGGSPPRVEEMTALEMVKEAEQMIGELRGKRDEAETSLRRARSEGNMAQLDCINEALIALKGVLKLAEDYAYDLEAAHKQRNVSRMRELLKKLRIAKKKIEDLDARVRSCGGPSTVTEGKPVIERVLDPDLPTDDPLTALETESQFIEKPAVTSPFN